MDTHFVSQLSDGWAFTLLAESAVKGGVLLLAGAAVAFAARRASASTRHFIWAVTVGAALVLPLFAAVLPRWRVEVLPSAPRVVATAAPAPIDAALPSERVDDAELAPTVRVSSDAAPVSAAPAPARADDAVSAIATGAAAVEAFDPPPTPTRLSWRDRLNALSLATILGAVWVAGVCLVLLPVLVGLVRVAIVARQARPLAAAGWASIVPAVLGEVSLRRRVRVLQASGSAMPMTWGILRPVILLPSDPPGWTDEQRRDALRHELCHVRRFDCLTQLIGQLACAVHWFNPLVWLAARHLRIERERACDDYVLASGARASAYASYLLEVAQSMHAAPATAFAALAMARRSQLSDRLLAVLDDRRSRARMSVRMAVPAWVGALAVVVPLAAFVPAQRQVATPPEAASTATTPERTLAAAVPAPAATAPEAAALPASDATLPPAALATRAISLGASPATIATGSAIGSSASTPLVVQPMPAGVGALPVIGVTHDAAATREVPFGIGALTSVARALLGSTACDTTSRGRRNGSTSSTNWHESDDDGKKWIVKWSQNGCRFELEAHGDIKLNRDATDVESISRGGSFELEERSDGDTRRILIKARSDGTLERTYWVNGDRREYDAAARQWMQQTIVQLDRRTAFAAEQRLPAILDAGGVPAALAEIDKVESDYARRIYYTKLFSLARLTAPQVKTVLERAGQTIESDYELTELVLAVSKLDSFDANAHTAYIGAVRSVSSDYERRRALTALLNRSSLSTEAVGELLKAAGEMRSDYEQAELLISVSKRYAIDERTRPLYIATLGGLASDYEHRRVLNAVIASGPLNADVTRALLQDAARIKSDYELAEFLISVGKKGTIDKANFADYFKAVQSIESDYEHHRALTALLRAADENLTKEMVSAMLVSARTLESDYECATFLTEVAKAYTIDGDLREEYFKTADTIGSEYDYGRAMAAVRRTASYRRTRQF